MAAGECVSQEPFPLTKVPNVAADLESSVFLVNFSRLHHLLGASLCWLTHQRNQ